MIVVHIKSWFPQNIPSWELTYPLKSQFLKMMFLFKVGYVSSLEGIIYIYIYIYVCISMKGTWQCMSLPELWSHVVYRNCEGLNADQVVLVEDDPQDSDFQNFCGELVGEKCWWCTWTLRTPLIREEFVWSAEILAVPPETRRWRTIIEKSHSNKTLYFCWWKNSSTSWETWNPRKWYRFIISTV